MDDVNAKTGRYQPGVQALAEDDDSYFEEHLALLAQVFNVAIKHVLMFKLDKCFLAMRIGGYRLHRRMRPSQDRTDSR